MLCCNLKYRGFNYEISEAVNTFCQYQFISVCYLIVYRYQWIWGENEPCVKWRSGNCIVRGTFGSSSIYEQRRVSQNELHVVVRLYPPSPVIRHGVLDKTCRIWGKCIRFFSRSNFSVPHSYSSLP